MSDSSPRWPGSNGAPGLDFSPRRTEPAAGEGSQGPSARLNGSEDGASSAETPPRPDAGPQAPGTHPGNPATGSTAAKPPAAELATPQAASGKPGKGPDPQESAASWAWQPLGAEPDSVGSSRSAASAGAADGATTIRSASSAPAVAAAGGAISGAAARAADQTKKPGGTTRRTPSPATSTPSAAATRRTGSRRTRKARLRLARLDPWSVMKTTFLFSIAFGIILMVIAWVLWTVLAGSGALDSLNQFMTTLIGREGEEFNVENYVNGPRVLGAAAVLAAIDIVILTAVATLFAFLYNLAATVIGGLEVTLAED